MAKVWIFADDFRANHAKFAWFHLIPSTVHLVYWNTKLTGIDYVSPVTAQASSGQTVLEEGSLAESCEKTQGIVCTARSQAGL
jgi:hypothetical protein